MPTFYLIDGHAQIYRAYYAPFRDLNGPDGTPVKATYVFAQMLLNLVTTKKPDYLAMVIDAAGDEGLHRTALYPQYKANRSAPPPDFFPQEQRILQLVRDAGVPIYHLPGWEADDVLATLAKKLEAAGFDVVLVTKDKDLRQLLSDKIRMYDVAADKFTTPESLREEMGFGPHEAVEIQSLMGDKIDNVPGIPGVGDKTAVELIKQFGSAQAVVDRWEEIKKPKLRESAKAFKDQLPITRQLVTLKTDLEVPEFCESGCNFEGLGSEALARHFTELGFTSLLKRLGMEAKPMAPQGVGQPSFGGGLFGDLPPERVAGKKPAAEAAGPRGEGENGVALKTSAEGHDYRLVNTPEKFAEFLEELKGQKRFAFDTETDDLGAMRSEVIGMSFSWAEGTGWYVAVGGPEGCPVLDAKEVAEALRPILEDESVKKYGHNIKYDILVLRNLGVRLKGLEMDTMVGAFLLDSSRNTYGIDKLAELLLGFKKIATVELIGSGKGQISMRKCDLDRVARYASEDADICLRLANLIGPKLAEVPRIAELAKNVEMPLVDVLAELEFNGIAVNPEMLREQSAVLGERIDKLRGQIVEAAGVSFNPDSPKQLGEVLFEQLKLKKVKKTKTGYSTDVQVLEILANEHPVPRLILEYRSLVKLKNTYLDNLTEYIAPRTGRIHTHFSPVGAATGRLSSSDPNLQNIPIRTDEGRRIRLAFVPGKAGNVLLAADYSQIELRILAHYTQEPALLTAFAKGEDIHRAVAAEVFGVPLEEVNRDQRGQAKTINFGIIYGVTAFGLARRIEGLTTSAADKLIRDYNARFPSIARFLDQCVMFAREHGYVETILGRRRPVHDIASSTLTTRNAAERIAINSVVQGSAADLIKVAMLRVYSRLEREKRASKMLLQVHDELVFETPREAAEGDAAVIKEEMIATGRELGITVPLEVEVGWGENWAEVK